VVLNVGRLVGIEEIIGR